MTPGMFQRHDDGSDKNTSPFGGLRGAVPPEDDVSADVDRRVYVSNGYEIIIVPYSILTLTEYRICRRCGPRNATGARFNQVTDERVTHASGHVPPVGLSIHLCISDDSL